MVSLIISFILLYGSLGSIVAAENMYINISDLQNLLTSLSNYEYLLTSSNITSTPNTFYSSNTTTVHNRFIPTEFTRDPQIIQNLLRKMGKRQALSRSYHHSERGLDFLNPDLILDILAELKITLAERLRGEDPPERHIPAIEAIQRSSEEKRQRYLGPRRPNRPPTYRRIEARRPNNIASFTTTEKYTSSTTTQEPGPPFAEESQRRYIRPPERKEHSSNLNQHSLQRTPNDRPQKPDNTDEHRKNIDSENNGRHEKNIHVVSQHEPNPLATYSAVTINDLLKLIREFTLTLQTPDNVEPVNWEAAPSKDSRFSKQTKLLTCPTHFNGTEAVDTKIENGQIDYKFIVESLLYIYKVTHQILEDSVFYVISKVNDRQPIIAKKDGDQYNPQIQNDIVFVNKLLSMYENERTLHNHNPFDHLLWNLLKALKHFLDHNEEMCHELRKRGGRHRDAIVKSRHNIHPSTYYGNGDGFSDESIGYLFGLKWCLQSMFETLKKCYVSNNPAKPFKRSFEVLNFIQQNNEYLTNGYDYILNLWRFSLCKAPASTRDSEYEKTSKHSNPLVKHHENLHIIDKNRNFIPHHKEKRSPEFVPSLSHEDKLILDQLKTMLGVVKRIKNYLIRYRDDFATVCNKHNFLTHVITKSLGNKHPHQVHNKHSKGSFPNNPFSSKAEEILRAVDSILKLDRLPHVKDPHALRQILNQPIESLLENGFFDHSKTKTHPIHTNKDNSDHHHHELHKSSHEREHLRRIELAKLEQQNQPQSHDKIHHENRNEPINPSHHEAHRKIRPPQSFVEYNLRRTDKKPIIPLHSPIDNNVDPYEDDLFEWIPIQLKRRRRKKRQESSHHPNSYYAASSNNAALSSNTYSGGRRPQGSHHLLQPESIRNRLPDDLPSAGLGQTLVAIYKRIIEVLREPI